MRISNANPRVGVEETLGPCTMAVRNCPWAIQHDGSRLACVVRNRVVQEMRHDATKSATVDGYNRLTASHWENRWRPMPLVVPRCSWSL